MRGGVSVFPMRPPFSPLSSPRAWGCFSTTSLKFIFHLGLPHVRGGVSRPWPAVRSQSASSPRAWGCFQSLCLTSTHPTVFPTCVGVFLKLPCSSLMTACLPHVRGGVSICRNTLSLVEKSSPRAWGCFLLHREECAGGVVFPTCVGVFLRA